MSHSSLTNISDVWDKIDAKAAANVPPKPTNHAAWQKEKGAPLVVGEAPLPTPGSGQILVKVGAMALNPADWVVRNLGIIVKSWPCILGCDAAGTVISVGPGIKQVQAGDRVFGLSMFLQRGNDHAAFQEYMLMNWPVFGKTPDNVSDAEAATFSLGTATAADGLFSPDQLGLSLPQSPPAAPKQETVIVWGGSTSVGACGIQMLAAAGYDIVTTASPHNFDFCKNIGAKHVFDHRSETVSEDLSKAIVGKKVAGALAAISTEQIVSTLCHILAATPDATRRVISVIPGEDYSLEGVAVTPANSGTPPFSELGVHLWGRFLPHALGAGAVRAAPAPKIVGKGLEAINGALDTLKAGVSASKLVVTL